MHNLSTGGLERELRMRLRKGLATKQSIRRAQRLVDDTIAKGKRAHEDRERTASRNFKAAAEENIERLLHASSR